MKHEEFLKQVKERAENATPGPWHCAGGIYVYSTEEMVADNNDEAALIRARGVGGGMSREQQEANVEFVAAANPHTVLKLLAIIEKLKVAMEDIANKNTCWRLYEIDKYKSYEDGWEGVAEFANKTLEELDEIVGQE